MNASVNKYRFKFYLNARHGMVNEGKIGSLHPHTWEICIIIKTEKQEFFKFSVVEKAVDNYISLYNSKLLNNTKPFHVINPTMENIGKVMYKNISKILNNNGWELVELQISENPTRTYFIDEYMEEMDVLDDINPLNYKPEDLIVGQVEDTITNENLEFIEDDDDFNFIEETYTRTQKMKMRKAKQQKIMKRIFTVFLWIAAIFFIILYYEIDIQSLINNIISWIRGFLK